MPGRGKISPIRIELLDRNRHDRAGFDCGVPALNSYLQRQAAQDMEKRAAVVYVASVEAPSIAGYYTLSQFSVELAHLPETVAKRLARYPIVSATLLGRLAVSNALKGQRLGETLLFDALRRSLAQSEYIASAGVVVDAKDDQAARFYQRYGFQPILDTDRRLFLHMKAIQQML
ncbi:MAG: GNAT family N-acetyltransferase [Terracidiphilus sp.]